MCYTQDDIYHTFLLTLYVLVAGFNYFLKRSVQYISAIYQCNISVQYISAIYQCNISGLFRPVFVALFSNEVHVNTS